MHRNVKMVFLLLLLPWVLLSQTKVHWLTDLDQAMAVSKKENKHVLVYFTGSDWCAPCQRLKTDLFNTPDFQAFSKDYVLVYLDYPRNRDLITPEQREHNKNVLPKLNKKKVFPYFRVLNSKGRPLDEYTGYSMTGDISYILRFLEENR